MKKRRYKWVFSPAGRMWKCYPLDTVRYEDGITYLTIEDQPYEGVEALVVDVAFPTERVPVIKASRRWAEVAAFPRTMRIKDMKRACEAMLDINIGGWP